MKNNVIISYIVPIFNVEKFVYKCIDSILQQSVANIEIILVNDGSIDKSGVIADEIALYDPRVRVFHNENQGVSFSRNYGLSKAAGKYVGFIDADDFIDPAYSEYMLSIAERSDADFIMSKNCYYFPSSAEQPLCKSTDLEIWDNEEACYELLYPGKIAIGCWNKLFRREFLKKNNITFSTGLYMGEGLKFILEAARGANKVAVGKQRLYYYRKDNFTSATTVINVPKYINAIKALDVIEKDGSFVSVKVIKALKYHRYLAIFYGFRAILVTKEFSVYHKEYGIYLTFLRRNLLSLLSMVVPLRLKVKVFAFAISPKLVSKLVMYSK